LAAVRSCFHS